MPRCSKCRDDGFYYTVPEGMNPFLLGADGCARVAIRVECNCYSRTDDVVTDAELIELFGTEEGEELGNEAIAVCEGEWRRDVPGKWRFWRDPTIATDA